MSPSSSDSPVRTRLREVAIAARAARIGRIVDKEGGAFDEVQDAIELLATTYPVTRHEVLDLVEEHGLAGAREVLARAS